MRYGRQLTVEEWEALKEFQREMETKTIPEIEAAIERRRSLVVDYYLTPFSMIRQQHPRQPIVTKPPPGFWEGPVREEVPAGKQPMGLGD
jgi:hypothetical protein